MTGLQQGDASSLRVADVQAQTGLVDLASLADLFVIRPNVSSQSELARGARDHADRHNGIGMAADRPDSESTHAKPSRLRAWGNSSPVHCHTAPSLDAEAPRERVRHKRRHPTPPFPICMFAIVPAVAAGMREAG